MVLFFGALYGFISVAFGGFAEHGLKETVSEADFNSIAIAITYNQINAVIISAIGLGQITSGQFMKTPLLKWSAILFILGTAMFSFTIYLSVVFESLNIRSVTPLGGMIIMIAWLLVAYAGLAATKTSQE